MTDTEETIRERFGQITKDLALPPLEYDQFSKKNHILSSVPESKSRDIERRDLEGLYLATGAEMGISEYIERIYRLYKGAMLTVAYHFFPRDESRAEDIVHDVFSAAKWGSYHGTGSFAGWLKTITANRCLDIIRAQKGRNLDLDKADLTEKENPETRTMSEECRKRLLSSVKKAFGDIGSQEKNLLTFTYVEGVTVRDLARTYKTSPATISRRVKSAREDLKRAITKYSMKAFSMNEEDIDRCLDLILGGDR